MQRREFFATTAIAALSNDALALEAQPSACDVFIYGSTPGGIAAALEASRRGLNVVLACPQKHPGGMAASGLCTTDAVRRHLFGGMVLEFVKRVREEYVTTL